MGAFTNHVDSDGGGGFAKSPHLGVCECLSIRVYQLFVNILFYFIITETSFRIIFWL